MPSPHRWALATALVLITLVAYAQVGGHGFVYFDDDIYVTQNVWVQQGLTSESFRWAIASSHASNWHPLTWVSHMLDVELFGLAPGGPHLVNLALHCLNAIVLFTLLLSMTGAVWRSWLVAALFALHPLHVESVAWVSERKDLLCALFGLLSMRAWVTWTRHGGAPRYALAALLLALGLMAKPMLVTLPVLLLLLDRWPLERLTSFSDLASLRRLSIEKLPLLAICGASAVVTMVVQSGARGFVAGNALPFWDRLTNAFVSYVRYLAKAVWPGDLSVLYPHPNLPGGTPWSAFEIVAAVALLAGITWAVIRSKRGYAVMGWAWYAISLLPVIGLIQVGLQAMADRYTYLPLIGPFVIVVWGGAEAMERLPARWPKRAAAGVLCALALLASSIATHEQAAHWQDTATLFGHSLQSAPGAPTLHNGLGIVLGEAGDPGAALIHFRAAAELDPGYPEAQLNLGKALVTLGRFDEALAPLRAGLELLPDHFHGHNDLGRACMQTGRLEEAAHHYREAVRINPTWVPAMQSAAWILATHPDEQIADPEAALALAQRAAELTRREDPAILDLLAISQAATGDFESAIETTEQAISLAESRRDTRTADSLRTRLGLYRRGQPLKLQL